MRFRQAASLSLEQLRLLTEASVERMLALLDGATNADVVFVPDDPEANDGRPRYETPWESITTIGQCRQRLEESRRIRVASLGMWPAEPDLDERARLSLL